MDALSAGRKHAGAYRGCSWLLEVNNKQYAKSYLSWPNCLLIVELTRRRSTLDLCGCLAGLPGVRMRRMTLTLASQAEPVKRK